MIGNDQVSTPWMRQVLLLFSPVTLSVVFTGSIGGLLVAFAIMYADAVLKTMATAMALVLVTVTEIMFKPSIPSNFTRICPTCKLSPRQTLAELQTSPPVNSWG